MSEIRSVTPALPWPTRAKGCDRCGLRGKLKFIHQWWLCQLCAERERDHGLT